MKYYLFYIYTIASKAYDCLGAIIALMPLALGIGTGAQLHQPLAIAVIGGFIAALPLLLIVLPSILRMISQEKKCTNRACRLKVSKVVKNQSVSLKIMVKIINL